MPSHRRRNAQKYRIVWLDPNINSSQEYADHRRQLKALTHLLETFSDPNACVETLYSIGGDQDRVFLIVSDILAQALLPLVDPMSHVHRIYLYSSNPSQAESWTKQYQKVRGNIFPTIQSICDRLKMDTTNSTVELVDISVISHTEIRAGNRQDPSFMYKQLLKDILLNDDLTDPEHITKQQMIEFCREVCKNNSHELRVIEEFDREFFAEHAVYWYTRDCFLYRMLNKALWTPEPVTLYKLRYFLRHLHKQIQTTAAEQSASALNPTKTKTVYRGQGIPTTEIDGLKKGVGGLLSFNNFLSTSVSRAVANDFAWESKLLSNQTPVMFIMKIETTNHRCPFIEVGHMGFYENREEEVLFSMGTVCRIEDVRPLSDGQWEVRLVLSEDVDDNLARYTAKTREKARSPHPLISLVKLMDEMGQYRMIDQFDSLFAENDFILENPILAGALQHALGSAYLSAGNRTKALAFLQNALYTYLNHLPENHPSLSPTYNNIGSVYNANKDYRNALKHHQKALDCQLEASNPDLDSVATYSMNIALVYQAMGEYNEALIHFNQALEIQEQSRGENHPTLSNTYNAIAAIYHNKKDYKQAGKLLVRPVDCEITDGDYFFVEFYQQRIREINMRTAHPRSRFGCTHFYYGRTNASGTKAIQRSDRAVRESLSHAAGSFTPQSSFSRTHLQ